jgi:hypothetical protein
MAEDAAAAMAVAIAENTSSMEIASAWGSGIGEALSAVGLGSSELTSQLAADAAIIQDSTSSIAQAGIAAGHAAIAGAAGIAKGLGAAEAIIAVLGIAEAVAGAAMSIARGIAGDYSQFAAVPAYIAAGVKYGQLLAKSGRGGGGSGGGAASAGRGSGGGGGAGASSAGRPPSRDRDARASDREAPKQIVINLHAPLIRQDDIAQVRGMLDGATAPSDGWRPPRAFSRSRGRR